MFKNLVVFMIFGYFMVIDVSCSSNSSSPISSSKSDGIASDDDNSVSIASILKESEIIDNGDKITININKKDFDNYIGREKDIILNKIEESNEDLLNKIINIVTGLNDQKDNVNKIFPVTEEDLYSIDISLRDKFYDLLIWVLGVVKPSIKNCLIQSVKKLDKEFLNASNVLFEEGTFEEFNLDDFISKKEIPNSVIDGCSVESILNVNPDFFPSDFDHGFKNLVLIIKSVNPYIEYNDYIDDLKKSIKAKMNEFDEDQIRNFLHGCNESFIDESIAHFKCWKDLEEKNRN